MTHCSAYRPRTRRARRGQGLSGLKFIAAALRRPGPPNGTTVSDLILVLTLERLSAMVTPLVAPWIMVVSTRPTFGTVPVTSALTFAIVTDRYPTDTVDHQKNMRCAQRAIRLPARGAGL